MFGFPLPDFDFDDLPLIPIEQPMPAVTPESVSPEFMTLCEVNGFQLIDKTPIRCTGNSSVYTASNNGVWALKFSKHKSRIIEEFQKRLHLPNSPFLVQSINVFETTSHAMLQMELCQEGDLTGREFDESTIWQLIHDIGCALAVVHENNWMHLDVSPSNILWTGSTFKLADFGTLVPIGEFRCGCEGAGPYVSLETMQFPGDSITGPITVNDKTDIFSFGVVLLELASGYYAPRGGDERYGQLRRGEIQLGDNLYCCNLSAELITLVNRMLSPNQDIRPTAIEIANHPCAIAAASAITR